MQKKIHVKGRNFFSSWLYMGKIILLIFPNSFCLVSMVVYFLVKIDYNIKLLFCYYCNNKLCACRFSFFRRGFYINIFIKTFIFIYVAGNLIIVRVCNKK